MADNFFKHYPLISYGNTVSVNILAKVAFQKDNDKNYYTYHPYTIKEGDRADTVAYLYYGDPGYDWIIYYSNQIVDPYYEWPMDTRTFKRFIESKYGSLSNSQSKIKFYRSNYISDFSLISTAAYDALSTNQKRFWAPVTGENNSIKQYERKKEDIIFETNKTIQCSVNVVSSNTFSLGENAIQKNGATVVAIGNVKFANSSTIIVDDIQGTFSNTYNITGSSSSANATVSSVNTISTSISSDIINYFEPVTFYDYENELNEKRKNIRLLDVSFVEDVVRQFKGLMQS